MRKLLASLAVASVLVGLAPVLSHARAEAPTSGRLSADLAAALETAAPDAGFLVFVQGVTPAAARSAVSAAGLASVGELRSIGVPIAAGTSAQIEDLVAQPGVTYVERDRPLTPMLDTSRQAIRATEASSATFPTGCVTTAAGPGNSGGQGNGDHSGRPSSTETVCTEAGPFDGTGQTIAVVDSGVDGTHPMFQVDGKSKVVRNLKVACVNHIPGLTIDWLNLPVRDADLDACPSRVSGTGADDDSLIVDMTDQGNDTDTASLGGHGTHVAGIAGGVEVTTEEATPKTFSGVATGAKIVSISQGQSITIYAENTAFDWILRNHDDPCGTGDLVACPPITVVNSSFGSSGSWDREGATTKLQQALVTAGITMVWANGNSGGDGTSNLSSNDGSAQIPGVISVANYDDGGTGRRDGTLDDTSSRGLAEDPLTWPDLSAPGTDITSACRPYLSVCATGLSADPNYATIGGTSMAAPHVAGAVAILQQAALSRSAPHDHLLTPAEVEDLLEDSAHPFGGPLLSDPTNDDSPSSFDRGHGLLDLFGALAGLYGAVPSDSGGETPTTCAIGTTTIAAEDSEGEIQPYGVNVVSGPYDAALDLTGLRVDVDAAAATITVTLSVVDLGDGAPSGGDGVYAETTLTLGAVAHALIARRDATGAQSFMLDDVEVAGAFDPVAETITAVVPYDAVAPAPTGTLDTMASVQIGRTVTAAVLWADDATTCTAPLVYGQTSSTGMQSTGDSDGGLRVLAGHGDLVRAVARTVGAEHVG